MSPITAAHDDATSAESSPAHGAHIVQFYERDEYLYDVVARFLVEGFTNDEALVVIATAAHVEAFEGRLLKAGIDVDRARATGQLTVLDASETLAAFMVEGMPSGELFLGKIAGVLANARRAGRQGRLRAYGEMVDVLWRAGNERAAIRLEELWNELGAKESFALLCAYTMGNFYRADATYGLEHVCAQHAHVHAAEGLASLLVDGAATARIQARARALEAEIAERQKLEQALREALAERRRAEEALHEKAQELTDFVENASEGLHWVNADGIIVWANRAELELLGYSRDEYVGRHIAEFHVDAHVISDMLSRLARNEELHSYEARLRAKDGSVKCVAVSSNVYWRDGRFGHTRCFTRDITVQKALIEQTQAAARRLSLLAEASRLFAASSHDLEKLFQAIGQQVTAAFGGACEIALLTGDEQFLEPRFVHHEDPKARAVLAELLRSKPRRLGEGVSGQSVATGRALRMDIVDQAALRAGAKPEYHSFLAEYPIRSLLVVPLRSSGRVLGTLGSARFDEGFAFKEEDEALLQDLADRAALAIENASLYERERSARLRAETAARRTRQLQHLTSALAAARTTAEVASVVVEAGREGLGASVSLCWLATADGQTLELVASGGLDGAGLPAFRHIPVSADLPVCEALRAGVPMTFGSREELERRYPATNAAAPAPLESCAVVPLLAQGRGVGGVYLSFDQPRVFGEEDRELLVSMAAQASSALERCRLFEAERAARALLEEADRRKDEFLAMLGHELRNPLAPIRTALQLMSLRGDQVVVRERSIIERQVVHLERLVDELLDVSRITRGLVELKKERLDLADILAKALEQVHPLVEERRHRLVVSVPRRTLLVDADEVRLAQILANLLTNAAKYTDAGGEIHVSAGLEQDMIVLRVRDNGSGIPAELLPRVFDLFTQANQTLARSQGGLGLGLAIVRQLVELHGGRVEAKSGGLGTGSEFSVWLPAARSTAEFQPAAKTTSGESVVQEARAQAPSRVLLVDDNRDAVTMLGDVLEMMGYEVRIAHDGPTAVKLATVFRPQVALLDIGLPVMDGYELARRLRDGLPAASLKLIALTGYGQERDRSRALQSGFDEHLIKPVDIDRLDALLRAQA